MTHNKYYSTIFGDHNGWIGDSLSIAYNYKTISTQTLNTSIKNYNHDVNRTFSFNIPKNIDSFYVIYNQTKNINIQNSYCIYDNNYKVVFKSTAYLIIPKLIEIDNIKQQLKKDNNVTNAHVCKKLNNNSYVYFSLFNDSIELTDNICKPGVFYFMHNEEWYIYVGKSFTTKTPISSVTIDTYPHNKKMIVKYL